MNKLIVKLDDKIIENFESTDGILLIKGGVNKENSDFAELNNVCNAQCNSNCDALCTPKNSNCI